jgi:predicted dehydrogenase
MNALEARRMLDAGRRHSGLTTMLVPASHTFWVDATLTRLLADGAIGALRTFDGAWNEPEVSTDPGEWWRHQRRFSGNNVQGIGPLYEVLLRWLPAPATAVTARLDRYEPRKPGPDGPVEVDNPDHASILLEYADGTAGNLEVSSHSAARGPSIMTLIGSEGALRVDLRARTLEHLAAGGDWTPIAIDPADVEWWDVEAEFVGAIRGDRAVRRNPFEIGVAYMAFSDAVVESAASGRRVEISR